MIFHLYQNADYKATGLPLYKVNADIKWREYLQGISKECILNLYKNQLLGLNITHWKTLPVTTIFYLFVIEERSAPLWKPESNFNKCKNLCKETKFWCTCAGLYVERGLRGFTDPTPFPLPQFWDSIESIAFYSNKI